MKTMRTTFVRSLIACATLFGAALASADDNTGVVQLNDSGTINGTNSLNSSLAPQYSSSELPDGTTVGYQQTDPSRLIFRLNKRVGGSIGNRNGTSNFSTLIPLWWINDDWMIFGDLHAQATDDGDGVFNAGAGMRKYHPAHDRVTTVAGYFDHDQSHGAHEYERLSAHFGSHGRWFDVNANGYLQVGNETNVVAVTAPTFPIFDANNIRLARSILTERAFSGFDVEVGTPVPLIGRYGVKVYAGGYYWRDEDGRDVGGFQGRVEGNINEAWKLSASISDDKLFGTNAWMNVILTLPDGKPYRWMRPQPGRAKMYNHVQRYVQVVTKTDESLDPTANLAVNPDDGLPYQVVHVDPNVGAGGSGTFEDPYGNLQSLVNGANFDIVFVNGRDDLSGTNLDRAGGLTLFDNQRLLSSGVQHTFVEQSLGTLTLPGFNGLVPQISNSTNTAGQSVVTLADNNEVSGFIIDGSDGAADNGQGIVSAATVTGFNINRNIFQNYTNAVVLTGASGTVAGDNPGLFTNNTMNGLAGTSVNGFSVTNDTGGTLDLLISGNTATDNSGNGFNVLVDGAGSVINADASVVAGTGFNNNVATANGTGGAFTAQNSGTLNIAFIGNTFDDNTDVATGVNVTSTGAGSTVTVSEFTSNLVRDNANGSGARFSAEAGATLTLDSVTDNTFSGNVNGLLLNADGAGSVLDADVGVLLGLTNTFSGNSNNGIRVTVANTATARGSIVNNTITGNTGFGLEMHTANTGGTLDFGTPASNRFITDNVFGSNTAGGTFIDIDGAPALGGVTTTANLVVQRNTYGSNADTTSGPGFYVDADGFESTLNLTIGGPLATDGNTFTDYNGSGIAVVLSEGNGNNLADDLLIQNNIITGTTNNASPAGMQGDAIFLSRGDRSLFNNAVVSDNSGSNSAGSGLRVFANGAASTDANQPMPGTVNKITYHDNFFLQNTNGVLFDLSANAEFHAVNTGNTMSDNNSYGLRIIAANSSGFGDEAGGLASTFDSDVFDNNGIAGISIFAQDDAFFDVDVLGTTSRTQITDNGVGIELIDDSTNTASGGNTLNVTATDILNSTTVGFDATLSGTGTTNVGIGGTATADRVNIEDSGTDGVNMTISAGDANDIDVRNVLVDGSGQDGFDLTVSGTTVNTTTVDIGGTTSNEAAFFTNSGGDGLSVVQTGGDLTLTSLRSTYNNNALRGVDVLTRAPTANVSQFLFGDGLTAANGNVMSGNGQQGMVWTTQAQTFGAGSTAGLTDPPVSGNYQNADPGDAFVNTDADFLSSFNAVQFNGADGHLLEVGTNTRMQAQIIGMKTNGNVLDDINIITVASGNPTTSIDGAGANADTVFFDPVAKLELLLGMDDSVLPKDDQNGFVTSSGASSVNGGGGFGEQISIDPTGSATAAVGSTLTGVFTNADPFKTGGASRTAFGQFTYYTVNGTLNDLNTGNVFTELGVTQDIEALVNGTAQVFGGGTLAAPTNSGNTVIQTPSNFPFP